MSNVFLVLPVPGSDGVGAWVDVSGLAPTKTLTLDGGAFAGQLFVECSNNVHVSSAPAPVPILQAGLPNAIEFTATLQFMRIRRVGSSQGPAGTPAVVVGGQATTSNVFGTLAVPSSNGTGAPMSLAAGGEVNTFAVVGAFSGSIFVELSNDGTDFSSTLRFDSGAAVPQTFRGVVASARVRQALTTGSPLPTVAAGSGTDTPSAGGAGGPQVPGTQVQIHGVPGSLDFVAGTQDLIYPWGVLDNFTGWDFFGNANVPANRLTAYPHLFPIACTLRDILIQNQFVGVASSHLKIGIYSNRAANLPYPLTLLWESASLLVPTGGAIVTVSPGLAVAAGTLLWIVFGADNAASLDLASLGPEMMMGPGLLGTFSTFGSPYAWTGIEYGAFPYTGVLPATFPNAAPDVTFTGDTARPPAFMIRFGP